VGIQNGRLFLDVPNEKRDNNFEEIHSDEARWRQRKLTKTSSTRD
jgi:hypothetical protein